MQQCAEDHLESLCLYLWAWRGFSSYQSATLTFILSFSLPPCIHFHPCLLPTNRLILCTCSPPFIPNSIHLVSSTSSSLFTSTSPSLLPLPFSLLSGEKCRSFIDLAPASERGEWWWSLGSFATPCRSPPVHWAKGKKPHTHTHFHFWTLSLFQRVFTCGALRKMWILDFQSLLPLTSWTTVVLCPCVLLVHIWIDNNKRVCVGHVTNAARSFWHIKLEINSQWRLQVWCLPCDFNLKETFPTLSGDKSWSFFLLPAYTLYSLFLSLKLLNFF